MPHANDLNAYINSDLSQIGVISPSEINGVFATKDELVSVGFDENDPVPLMFQTGYLTIGSYDRESGLYELRFPNREVEIGFFKHLLRCYAPLTASEAMEQIHERDYAGRYAMDNRTVYLVGANFTENKETRGLEYKIENLK